MNTYTSSLEPDTRVLIDHSLESLGWKLKGANRNVFFERPLKEKERKKLDGKRPDYVLYSDGEIPLIVIEAKRKGSPLNLALDQGIFYARAIGAPLVFATDGVFCKSFHTVANRPPILNGEEIDEFIREALAIQFLDKYEVNTVSPKVQYDRKELIYIFNEANNMLRGDGLRAGIERFGEFANILFLKLISENEQIKQIRGEKSKFDIESCSWDSIKKVADSARIEYINNTVYPRLNNLYSTEIFTPLTIRNETILKDIMDRLDPLTLTDVDSDVKGDAFEYFLRASTATGNDLGEYFTPRHIVKTMVRLINPKIGEKIYDPFCGTGGFLIESFRHIERSMGTRNAKLRKILREETIFGNEITNTARITKMNMILAGDGHSNIEMKDSLANPTYIDKIEFDEDGKVIRDDEGNIKYSSEYGGVYDVVITNMPYAQRTKYGDFYDIPSARGDSICVQHCIKAVSSTAENGRMALVVPEGFLFRKDLTRTREYLLSRCQLQSIISLPRGVFLPYTGVKTDIIYATKVNQKVKSSEPKKSFWYFEVKNDGYTLDNHRRKLDTPSDLVKYEEYRKLDEDQAEDMVKFGFELIPLDKVRDNSCILVGNRYREPKMIISKFGTTSIGDVCNIIHGYSFPLKLQGESGTIPFYKVSDMNSFGNEIEMRTSNNYVSTDTVKVQKWNTAPSGTIIFPKIGAAIATNKKRILSIPAIFDNNIMGIICGEKVLPKFMFYVMTSIDISKWASLANPPSILKDTVLNQQFPLPPIEIQRQLINELDGYQQVIDGAKKVLNGYRPKINYTIESKKTLEEIATFRPPKDEVKSLSTDTMVSFVPMATINEFDESFTPNEERKIGEVLSGFTYFRDNDILLAKITPCFENGKAGIARNLKNGIGFGSTEYIVIRANTAVVYPEWIFYNINTTEFIDAGKSFMTGTAGQRRIDINYVKQYHIPVPSLTKQKEILDQIKYEQSLIAPSKKLIEVFTGKIQDRIKAIWGDYNV